MDRFLVKSKATGVILEVIEIISDIGVYYITAPQANALCVYSYDLFWKAFERWDKDLCKKGKIKCQLKM